MSAIDEITLPGVPSADAPANVYALIDSIDSFLLEYIRPNERRLAIQSKLGKDSIMGNKIVQKCIDQMMYLNNSPASYPIYSHVSDEYAKTRKGLFRLFTAAYPNLALLSKELQDQFIQSILLPYIMSVGSV
jgi:hypothetical protein